MNYRLLGRTGLYVSELCFGAMTFGGEGIWKAIGTSGQKEADTLVGRCLEAGINFFDTADVYSHGASEQLLGKALGARRKDIVLATKVRGRVGPGVNELGLSRGHILDSVHASLKRLGTDYIDLYQIHGFDAVTPLDETLRALDDLVRQGKVRYLGASNLAAWQLMKALGISEHRGLSRFESLQAYYSIAGRDLEREVVPLMKDQQVGLMVWSPLAGGFLSGKYRRGQQGPEGSRRATFDFPPVDRERAYNVIDVMDGIAREHQSSVARVALAWLLHQPHVTTIVIGAKTAEQLEDNLETPKLKLTAEQLTALNTASALTPEYPGWMVARQGEDRSPKPQS
ncbi:aldo/keto reductase [Stigmatella aurantiaca]|uniref:Aldo/keto reductase n=1 Tax=Stigmatella aurantiaca (strain DW4/3-1) TaxID=378806 RepID=Q09D31_STIAD|nr:aldo/keto reductase [Stigmatella aurantiaca]ADO67882.1 Aldo/keto reductase [Stigmatella aurantiaca DW4/3-1]EAU69599.1 oxidoreductase [Stigmatella aurantiaca DW4/3-1]